MPEITQPVAEVDTFLARLDHPRKLDIEAVRGFILGVDPRIGEAVKWNAPSFRTTEFFATFHLRDRESVRLVFHLGAKKRAAPPKLEIDDPEGLLDWLAPDRAMLVLGRGPEIAARRAALETIVRGWIAAV